MLVMQRFRVVYYGITYEPLVFFRYTHKPLGHIPWYIKGKLNRTILYQVIETVANTKYAYATYAQHSIGKLDVILLTIQRLSCFLIACIFLGMV